MSSLRNMGGDRWQVTVYAGRDAAGRQKRITKVFHAPGIKAAKRQVASIEAELRERVPDRSHGGRTVGWLVDQWTEHRASLPTSSPTTIVHNRYITDRLKKDLGPIRLDDLSPIDIERWYAQLRRTTVNGRKLSESRVHHYHRILKAIIRQGHKWGFVDRVVIERVTAPAPRKRPVVPPSSNDVAALLKAAPGDLATLLRVYAATGARRSEVLGLRWTDLDGSTLTFQRTVVQVNGQPLSVKPWLKNPDEPPRVVRIDDDTVALLERYREHVRQGLHDVGSRMGDGVYMFPDLRVDPSGRTPRHPDAITRVFGRACKAANVQMRLHDLRHWHASQLLDAGLPMTTVSERLGHSQVSTTMNIYAHGAAQRDHAAAAAIGAVLEGKKH